MPSHEFKSNLLKQDSFSSGSPFAHPPCLHRDTYPCMQPTHTRLHTSCTKASSPWSTTPSPPRPSDSSLLALHPAHPQTLQICLQNTLCIGPPFANPVLQVFLSDKISRTVNLKTKPCPQISFAWPTEYWIIDQHLIIWKLNTKQYRFLASHTLKKRHGC